MRQLATSTIFALAALTAGCMPPASTRNSSLMNEIERQVRLPRGAGELHQYARYYSWIEERRKVHAVYIRGGRLGRRWLNYNYIPQADVRGCNAVALTYDAEAERVEAIGCVGAA